ncbi:MAG: acyl-CoA dehydrogenase family protein [Acidobacteria bacterium]|nr:acyl-CoA dehydrogenase family protein [Acidobacteriota bacterium]
MAAPQTSIVKGGSFLITETAPESVFSPEDFTEEHRMIAQTTNEYLEKEVVPNSARIEEKDYELQRQLLQKGGELGLLAASIPEAYGGLALDHVSSTLISEYLSGQGSFVTTFGATTSIGTLPIVYFGNEEQKKKYLPKLATGEWVGAYCLSESGSGSDALAAKTTARLNPEGTHWVLNGEKMWISNGAFADVYIVFAKVDGEKFTGFIVERNDPGVSPGAEEHKLGQRGSSTTPLLLQEAKIPKDRLLGEIGKGHLIAFNILNFGRFKLGAGCIGGSKRTLGLAARYAAERRQFGVPIATFGAIKYKLAEMLTRTYVGESAVYRTVGLIEDRESTIDKSNPAEVLAAIEEYAVESSILKVAGSEILDYVADEAVQIYGGNGFTSSYPVEAIYRDNRVNRIFEGTNEINRLLIPGQLLKRAMKGHLPLLAAAQQLQEELLAPPSFDLDEDDAPLAEERRLVANSKKVALAVLGTAAQKFMMGLEKQQMILTWAADIIIESYLMDSALGRTLKKIARDGAEKHEAAIDATRLYINDAMGRIESAAKNALAATVEGDELRTLLAALRRFTKYTPLNTSAIRERLADKVVAAGGYIF